MSSVVTAGEIEGATGGLRLPSHPVRADLPTMLDLPAKLRVALERADITARDLANRLRVDESTVSLWLSGQRTPRVKNLEKIAKALGVEMAKLWDGPQATPANKAQQSVMDDMNHLDDAQQEAVAALVRAMRSSGPRNPV